jgi:hypothetical protein
LNIWFSNGKLSYMYNDYGAGFREYNSPQVPSLNTWYHMCVVVGGGANPGSFQAAYNPAIIMQNNESRQAILAAVNKRKQMTQPQRGVEGTEPSGPSDTMLSRSFMLRLTELSAQCKEFAAWREVDNIEKWRQVSKALQGTQRLPKPSPALLPEGFGKLPSAPRIQDRGTFASAAKTAFDLEPSIEKARQAVQESRSQLIKKAKPYFSRERGTFSSPVRSLMK